MKSSSRPSESPELLRQQARAWLRLLQSAQVSAVDGEAFRRWLAQSAAHKTAFNEVRARWETMGAAAGEYAQRHPQALRGRKPLVGRRAWLGAALGAAGAVAAVAVVGVSPGGLHQMLTGEAAADVQTEVGEQRSIALSSRVLVTLNTRTSVREAPGTKATGLTLLSGEAAVDLAQSGQAFTVAAGAGSASAHEGRFEVRFLEGRVCVTCLAGKVEVTHPAGRRSLLAMQQMVYDAHNASGVGVVDPANASAWRRGELIFNQVRLGEVLAEIDRYRSGRVMLVNDSAREQRVSGRFRIASLDAALAQLENTFKLNARTLPGGLLILS